MLEDNKTVVVNKEFQIHNTPLEKISMYAYSVEIELDNAKEKRYKLLVKPFVAYKVTSIDSVKSTDFYNEYSFRDGRYHRHILEMIDSEWIEELKKSTSESNRDIFTNKKHFVLPLQDNVIEIVANEITIQEVTT